MTIVTGSVKSPNELRLAIELANRVFFDGTPHFEERYPLAFAWINHDRVWVAKDKDRMVSMVVAYPAWLKFDDELVLSTWAVGAVCTDPQYRGQGLSSRLLELAQQRAIRDRVDVMLISGEGGLYERFGSRAFGTLVELIIPVAALPVTPVNHERHTSIDVRLVQHLLDIQRQSQPRFLRTEDEMAAFLGGHLYRFDRETAAILTSIDHNDYVVVRTGFEGSTRVAYVIEWGGTFETILALAVSEAQDQRSDKLVIRIPQTVKIPSPWVSYGTVIPVTGSMKVINALSLVTKLKAKWSAAGHRVGITLEQHTLKLSIDQQVVFDGLPIDLPPVLWGSPDATLSALPRLPSFNIDNLNFL